VTREVAGEHLIVGADEWASFVGGTSGVKVAVTVASRARPLPVLGTTERRLDGNDEHLLRPRSPAVQRLRRRARGYAS
jgi:hypothetical protein